MHETYNASPTIIRQYKTGQKIELIMNDNVKGISIDEFDYPLPDERIAKYPLTERDRCKLLVRQSDGVVSDHIFAEIPALLPEDAMLIYNNTRVINARLRFRKGENADGSLIEIFCLEPYSPRDYAQNFASADRCSWVCFVGNSKRWKSGALRQMLNVGGREVTLSVERIDRSDNTSVVEFSWNDSASTFSDIIAAAGEIPIPPYLNRKSEATDAADYQTVYSHIEGSVAAPTAGLHFTDNVLSEIDSRGIPRREVTLHVGAGTFQPVKSETIGGHLMHSEFIAVDRELISELASTSRRIIAVGTTSVRTLESLYHIGCSISEGSWEGELPQWYPYCDNHPDMTLSAALAAIVEYLDERNMPALIASTRIIIAPGYEYKVVSGMVTNFHQPKSTLLLLVSAFLDGDWRRLYNHALDSDYRFLSYGDAMLLMH